MPNISVVIPSKNRSALLAETIERIESQTVSRENYEVIVIDNDSSDDTMTPEASSNRRRGSSPTFVPACRRSLEPRLLATPVCI
jgi:GT2 family glycosyltransferase